MLSTSLPAREPLPWVGLTQPLFPGVLPAARDIPLEKAAALEVHVRGGQREAPSILKCFWLYQL